MAHRDTTRRAVILTTLVVVVAAWLAHAEARNFFFDLRVYYGAVQHWLHDGGDIYSWVRPRTKYGFTYPPFAAVVLAPLAYLPFPLVIALMGAATVAGTALVMWWLVASAAPHPRWYALGLALCLALAFEPVRETFSFGQVNLLLLVLVAADLIRGLPQGRRWAGVGIGLATAIKLTPGVFIVYLLVTRQWRAAATASGTAAVATLGAAAISPEMSRAFWTVAVWNTNRVGDLGYVSNQSLRGMVARLPLTGAVGTVLWLTLVLAVVAWWAWRVWDAGAVGEQRAGLALTGVLGCLISPVSWVHHLVWVLPAVVVVVQAGRAAAPGSRERRLLWVGVAAYVVMSSRLLWVWENEPDRVGEFVGGNLDVWCSLLLLALIPVRGRAGVTHLGQRGDATARTVEPDGGPFAVRPQP